MCYDLFSDPEVKRYESEWFKKYYLETSHKSKMVYMAESNILVDKRTFQANEFKLHFPFLDDRSQKVYNLLGKKYIIYLDMFHLEIHLKCHLRPDKLTSN